MAELRRGQGRGVAMAAAFLEALLAVVRLDAGGDPQEN
jgi:hypothetical protein